MPPTLKEVPLSVSAIRWIEDDIPPSFRGNRDAFNPTELSTDFGGVSFGQLVKSIEKYQYNPIFVVKSDRIKEPGRGLVAHSEPYTVLVGHYRLWALIALGRKVVSAVVVKGMMDVLLYYGIEE